MFEGVLLWITFWGGYSCNSVITEWFYDSFMFYVFMFAKWVWSVENGWYYQKKIFSE